MYSQTEAGISFQASAPTIFFTSVEMIEEQKITCEKVVFCLCLEIYLGIDSCLKPP